MADRLRRRIANWLRNTADRLDHAGAPKRTHFTFTFEPHEGIRVRTDGRGCWMWYLGDDQYSLAHSQADGAIRLNPR